MGCQYCKVHTLAPGNSILVFILRNRARGRVFIDFQGGNTHNRKSTLEANSVPMSRDTTVCAVLQPLYKARVHWKRNEADLYVLAWKGLRVRLSWGGGGESNVWTLRCLGKGTHNAMTCFQFWRANAQKKIIDIHHFLPGTILGQRGGDVMGWESSDFSCNFFTCIEKTYT